VHQRVEDVVNAWRDGVAMLDGSPVRQCRLGGRRTTVLIGDGQAAFRLPAFQRQRRLPRLTGIAGAR
jgi:hypothetical protein